MNEGAVAEAEAHGKKTKEKKQSKLLVMYVYHHSFEYPFCGFKVFVYCFDPIDVFVWLLGGSFPTTHHFLDYTLDEWFNSKVTYLVKKGEWERWLPIGCIR